MSQVPPITPAMPRPVLPMVPPMLMRMGVGAVVVAVFSILASLLTAGYAASLYVASNAARNRVLRNAPLVMPVSVPGRLVRLRVRVKQQVGRHGLNEYQRSAVVSAFQPLIPMTPRQAGQLDALLAEDGDEVFGMRDGQTVPADEVLGKVADHIGPLASNNADSTPFYFETPTGRAEIYSDRALFYRQSSPVIVRAVAGRRLNATGHPILQPADVDALILAARESSGRAMVFSQEQALRALLCDPQQKLVSLNEGPDGPYLGLDRASVGQDGYALISFAGGPLLLDPKGNIVLRTGGESIPVVNPFACAATVGEGLVSIGLAGFLLVTGIRLRRSPRVPLRSVRVYTILKTLVAVAGGAAAGWMTASFLSLPTLTRGAPSSDAAAYGAALGAIFAVIGCAFPVALDIASRSKEVRTHLAMFE